ncbi:pantoate kinase [Halalkaliarchaeum desulfuricum]|uniref:Pantoate kinase n=1 Tax=Halalkaliarchaeum desulfuricum TaxID=2055893 RepID=A0A343TI53_9EURY|nr:GHMP kinase [Halalkaliarchaeum desulfuricum]AUX08775.1 pantoate kinase [Halalkaliarchaeum desulfuricum]
MVIRAFAPGSVTGLFAPPPAEGGASRGASFAIRDGVVVELEPADTISVTVEGEPAPFEPVEGLCSDLGVTASVDVRPEVPLGHGFGASGAATLATAIAAADAFDLPRSRAELVDAAHRAEMAAGTGQGDVFIQERGGLLWTTDAGIRRTVPSSPIEYATAGGIDTATMLDDEAFMTAARRAGIRGLDALDSEPTLRQLAERSREYVAETGIATSFVDRQIERVEAAGGAAGMALFGETVFAVDVDGILPERTHVSPVGARLLSGT